MKLSEALNIRKIIEKAAESLADTEALGAPVLFPSWKSGTEYTAGNRVCFNGTLYKCITSHTAQSDWTPDVSVSLFVKITDPSVEYPEWVQPSGAHDAYGLGAKVSHNGKRWTSELDNNVHEPGVYGWEGVTNV